MKPLTTTECATLTFNLQLVNKARHKWVSNSEEWIDLGCLAMENRMVREVFEQYCIPPDAPDYDLETYYDSDREPTGW